MPINATEASPSQGFVPIERVHDGVLLLKDGSVRTILMASSINIVLKSAEEQAAILSRFQSFLNSLDFSIQVCVQSRELDIRPYVALLEQRYTAQTSELMKIQVREYIEFVKSFVENSSIMTKAFYIVVPYNPPALGGDIKSMFSTKEKTPPNQKVSAQVFEEYRSQLEQRVSVVTQGLASTGVRVARLGTEEVVELFYHIFNLGELDRPIPVSELTQ
jgi:type IV secretory pathway VirB4 component